MRQLIEWAREMREPSEFLSTLKVDLYPEEVYTFTPKGKSRRPAARRHPGRFRLHHSHRSRPPMRRREGEWPDGAAAPRRSPMATWSKSLTQKGHGPSRDWLSFVRTSHARSKIRQWINLHERQQATEVGRRLVEREARQSGVSLKKISEEDLLRVASEYGRGQAGRSLRRSGLRQIFRAAGPRQAHGPAAQAESPDEKQPKLVSTVKRMLGIAIPAILVLGHDDLMVYRAKCCNPIPGDPIVGYVTRGRGVAVHSKTCPNVQNLLYQSERRMPVEWASATEATFPVRLRIFTEDRPGMLASITAVISETGANIRTFESGGHDMRARIEVALDVHDRRQLERILGGVKRIPGVFDIERVYNV